VLFEVTHNVTQRGGRLQAHSMATTERKIKGQVLRCMSGHSTFTCWIY